MRALLPTVIAFTTRLVLSTQDVPLTQPDSLVRYTIAAEGINASFIAYGARSTKIYVKDKDGVPREIVMGYDEGSGYVNDTNNEHT